MLATSARRGNTEGNGTMARVFRGKIAILGNQGRPTFRFLAEAKGTMNEAVLKSFQR